MNTYATYNTTIILTFTLHCSYLHYLYHKLPTHITFYNANCLCITGAIHKFPVMANGNTDTKKLTNTIKKRKRKKKEKTSRSY